MFPGRLHKFLTFSTDKRNVTTEFSDVYSVQVVNMNKKEIINVSE